MIEVFSDNVTPPEMTPSPFSSEDCSRGANKRTPRRAQTYDENFLPSHLFALVASPVPSPSPSSSPSPSPPTPDNGLHAPSAPPSQPAAEGDQDADRQRAPTRRPPLGPPRRSYSVTDKPPGPHRRHRHRHRHGRPDYDHGLSLMGLPAELHYVIMSFLDPIDSTCLGLTSKHFYAMHRRLHGTVPLTARRDGPNDLEWAWHWAGSVVPKEGPARGTPRGAPGGQEEKTALARLRVRGHGYCRMCGVTRCELHKHVQEWVGEGLEYCSVKQKFGPVAPEGARSYCYMSRPGDPSRCGRHKGKSTVQLR
ncbi:hypothetical protein VTJ83DRAFT_7450 [Remersonia thermophila]|uniref:F-box domain-containing protein n=1 Tax=Remersonia thermophila TaxID=72144 RepID=A0ABR4D3I3_9PEZI